MPNIIKARFKLRAGTAAHWASTNDVLADSEMGRETDTGRIKVGPGAWNGLPYSSIYTVSNTPSAGQVMVYNAATGEVDWADQSGGGSGINITNRVGTYGDLPSPPPEGTGATYLVKDGGSYPDNLLYVWDGSSWPAEGEGAPLNSSPSSPISTWWRLYITEVNLGSGGREYACVQELVLNAVAGFGSEIQPRSTFQSSSISANEEADKAFNHSMGALDNQWISADVPGPHYIGARLWAPSRLESVTVYARVGNYPAFTNAPKAFAVQRSDDTTDGTDGTWTTEFSVSNQVGWGDGEARTFTRPFFV